VINMLLALAMLGQVRVPPKLTWQDPINPAGTTYYTVYRSQGLCSGVPAFNKIAQGITNNFYFDTTTPSPGPYCYAVSATVKGNESAVSMPAVYVVK
jgi:hypothetical protein